MPAFVNRLSTIMPGFGCPSMNGTIFGTAATGAAQTLVIAATTTTPSTNGTPFNPTGMPAPTRGRARLRSSSVTGTIVLTSITATDGTTTVVIAGGEPATVAAQQVDLQFDFITDLSITSITFSFTVSTAVGTVDAEVSLV